ncbi:MAG: hypothetical protein LBU32_31170 [Clostridiales bacterium]|nr:hypothetical protein [Clostridiales bacterium]
MQVRVAAQSIGEGDEFCPGSRLCGGCRSAAAKDLLVRRRTPSECGAKYIERLFTSAQAGKYTARCTGIRAWEVHARISDAWQRLTSNQESP